MHTLLKTTNQTPIPRLHTVRSAANESRPALSPRLRQKLLYMHVSSFDWQYGGLKSPIKFLDRDSIEYSLCQAAAHDKNEERMARLSLDSGAGLIDSVEGGIFQFATQNNWDKNHYSKSMAAQAGSLRLYSLAFAQFHEYNYLKIARNIRTYLKDKCQSKEGDFRCSPTNTIVNIHARRYGQMQSPLQSTQKESAWAIEALASFYEYCGDNEALSIALKSANWLKNQHEGILRDTPIAQSHSRQTALPVLLAMSRAYLQLYRCTARTSYLSLACELADVLNENFRHPHCGFTTLNDGDESGMSHIDENICAGRFFNLLHAYTTDFRYMEMAQHAMRYLIRPEVATSRVEEAGILLLDEELETTPLKINIIGQRQDKTAWKQYQNGLRTPGWYKVIHWQCDNSTPG